MESKTGNLPKTVILYVLVLAALGPAFGEPQGTTRRPRIAMVVAPRDFTDREYAEPRAIFEDHGAIVRVVSTGTETAVSHDGSRLPVDQATADLALDQFDALVIVGGTGVLTYLMDDGALRRIVAAASASGKVVAAICVAPAVLARAGALRNRRATCYRDARIIGVLKRDGAEYADETVVTSGAVVTANGPEAARDFSFRVLDALKAMSE